MLSTGPGFRDLKLAGEVGIEPTNAGIKIRCLTTWRLPSVTVPQNLARDDNPTLAPRNRSYRTGAAQMRPLLRTQWRTRQKRKPRNLSLPLSADYRAA